jgi:uncharacterized protein YcnI
MKGTIMNSRLLPVRAVTRAGLAVGILGGLIVLTPSVASAHVGVDLHGATATAGSSTALWLRPGHGCDGDATNAVTVTLPDGISGAKAQPKPGWKLTSDGHTITWSGGALPDDQFDDFGIRLSWPKAAGGSAPQKYYFPTVQTCNAELKVTSDGAKATVTGWLPALAGQQVSLFVDEVPLTAHPVTVNADGSFSVATTSTKVPEAAEVTAKQGDRLVGTSIRRTEAWVDIPGQSATTDMPAPSVTVNAPATTS